MHYFRSETAPANASVIDLESALRRMGFGARYGDGTGDDDNLLSRIPNRFLHKATSASLSWEAEWIRLLQSNNNCAFCTQMQPSPGSSKSSQMMQKPVFAGQLQQQFIAFLNLFSLYWQLFLPMHFSPLRGLQIYMGRLANQSYHLWQCNSFLLFAFVQMIVKSNRAGGSSPASSGITRHNSVTSFGGEFAVPSSPSILSRSKHNSPVRQQDSILSSRNREFFTGRKSSLVHQHSNASVLLKT